MNLTKQNWPLGYLPSQDAVNGNPSGLMRMDNCYLDELGVLSLVRGIQRLTPTQLVDFPYRIYSKILSQTNEAIWASLGTDSSQIVRTAKGDFSDTTVVGFGSDKAAFGDCFGQVICCAGITRIKDNTTVVNNLGLITALPPVLYAVSQPQLALTGTWTVPEGTLNTTNGITVYAATTPSNASLIALETFAQQTDTTNINGGQSEDPNGDTIQFDVTPDDPANVTSIRLEFVLGNNNYYYYDFDPSVLTQGSQATTTLTVLRGQFSRLGHVSQTGNQLPILLPNNLNWTTVQAIKITVTANLQMNFSVGNVIISGGVQGQVNGTYSYIQVNVNDNGFYQAKSPASVASPTVSILNGNVIIQPQTVESQVNQIWIYRFGGNLDQYYRVGITTPGVNLNDNNTDTELLEINIPLNPFIKSMIFNDPGGNNIQDTIYGIEGPFYDRMLYMGLGFVYISDAFDPDCFDPRYTIKAFGDPSEKNLWIKKLTNNVCVLGTNKNLYEITGTFQSLPDGTLDISINPIGENHPPITDNVCASQGSIFYIAADGIRQTNGSNSTLISPQLRSLFQGLNKADVPPFVISAYGDYPLSVGKTRLMCSIPSIDGTQRLFVYDLLNQYWRFQVTNPISIFTTQTDRVLLGYNAFQGAMGGDIYLMDKGLGFTDNSNNLLGGFPLEFRTVFDNNGQPRNRKDTFTLKLIVDTGGVSCNLFLAKDAEGSPYQFIGSFATNGLTTVYFPLNQFTLGFRYSVRIVDNGSIVNGVYSSSLLTFKLYEMTIEYEPRPEQLDYLYIQPSNLGTVSRKRIVNYAFVIDTLGNNITFTPLIDNSNTGILPATRTVNTPAKQTYIYYFTQEQIGTDVNGILSGGVFEFYGLNEQEIISEKMPVPCEYLIIPNNDYGIPNRKRHSSYKFQINTRGQNVKFTPKLDGVLGTPTTYNTTEKRIVEYFFTNDTIARDIGGILQSLTDTPFEFYGVVTPQQIEQLPPRLEYFRIPNNNFGTSSRKRIRTIPMVIDTYGQPVLFNPIVDGSNPADTPATFITSGKTTVWYYFDNDSFGVDYGGELIAQGTSPFEFYGFAEDIQDVEILPVGKLFDQIGPVRFDKIGKLFRIRIRMISTGNTNLDVLNFPFTLYGDNNPTIPANATILYNGTFQTFPGIDYVYDIPMPKSVNSNIMRLALGPVDSPFYRYDVQFKVSQSGMESDSQWIPVR